MWPIAKSNLIQASFHFLQTNRKKQSQPDVQHSAELHSQPAAVTSVFSRENSVSPLLNTRKTDEHFFFPALPEEHSWYPE